MKKRKNCTVIVMRDGIERCVTDDCQMHQPASFCLTPEAPETCHCVTCDYWSELAVNK